MLRVSCATATGPEEEEEQKPMSRRRAKLAKLSTRLYAGLIQSKILHVALALSDGDSSYLHRGEHELKRPRDAAVLVSLLEVDGKVQGQDPW